MSVIHIVPCFFSIDLHSKNRQLKKNALPSQKLPIYSHCKILNSPEKVRIKERRERALRRENTTEKSHNELFDDINDENEAFCISQR